MKLQFLLPITLVIALSGCISLPEQKGMTAEELSRLADCPGETAAQRQQALREDQQKGELQKQMENGSGKVACKDESNQQAEQDESRAARDAAALRREQLRQVQDSVRSATESLGGASVPRGGPRLPRL